MEEQKKIRGLSRTALANLLDIMSFPKTRRVLRGLSRKALDDLIFVEAIANSLPKPKPCACPTCCLNTPNSGSGVGC